MNAEKPSVSWCAALVTGDWADGDSLSREQPSEEMSAVELFSPSRSPSLSAPRDLFKRPAFALPCLALPCLIVGVGGAFVESRQAGHV